MSRTVLLVDTNKKNIMKALISLIALCALFFFTSCGDDNNSPEPVTPTEKDVYAAGVTIREGVGRAVWWKNGTENIVGDGLNPSTALDVWVDKSDVYLCGRVNNGTNIATYWKNGTAVALENGYSSADAIVISKGDVYVAGMRMSSETNKSAATVWKNGVAQQISDATFNEFVRDMFVQNNDVYVAGFAWNGSKQVATYWKNSTKVFLSEETTVASSIFVSGNDVYACGWENKAGVYRACYWKNGNITYLTNGTHAAEAYGIFVSGTDIYVAGRDNNIATYWKNGTPTSVFLNSGFENAYAVAVSGDDVYVSGYAGNIALYWHKSDGLTQLSKDFQGEVRALFVK